MGVSKRLYLSLDLLLQQLLQGDGVSRELGDTLTQLLDRHLVLVEVEAEERLVVQVAALGDVQVGSTSRVKLLGDRVLGVVQLLQEVGLEVSVSLPIQIYADMARGTYGDGQVVDTGKLGDLTGVTERSTHDDGLVAVLLVVVVDVLNGLDTGVLRGGVVLLRGVLVPVEDTADEGGDEEGTGLGGGDGLDDGEHEGQVAVDAVLRLQDVRSLDTLPGRGDLDQDTVLGDANGLVELRWSAPRPLHVLPAFEERQYLDDVQGLVDRGLGVEGEAGVDLSRDLAGDDVEDLLAELDQQAVEGGIDLLIEGLALFQVSASASSSFFFKPLNGQWNAPAACRTRRHCR